MRILVDTSVWSLAFRRGLLPDEKVVDELRNLIADARALLIGPVRQELLSGVARQEQFKRLCLVLEPFEDLEIERIDYELAAQCFNTCRRSGIQGSQTDFLICAVAIRQRIPIFTTDKDFQRYSRHLPIKLHT